MSTTPTTDALIPATVPAQRLRGICVAIGFDPENVASIILEPLEVTVETYDVNDKGERFQRDGEIATTFHTLKVTS